MTDHTRAIFQASNPWTGFQHDEQVSGSEVFQHFTPTSSEPHLSEGEDAAKPNSGWMLPLGNVFSDLRHVDFPFIREGRFSSNKHEHGHAVPVGGPAKIMNLLVGSHCSSNTKLVFKGPSAKLPWQRRASEAPENTKKVQNGDFPWLKHPLVDKRITNNGSGHPQFEFSRLK